MHIDISACGDASCWVYSNENVSGRLWKDPKWRNMIITLFRKNTRIVLFKLNLQFLFK